MRITSSLGLCLALWTGSSDALSAAQSVPIVPGDRVRIWARGLSPQPLTGTLAALNSDSVVIHPDQTPAVRAIARGELSRIQVSRGRRSNVGGGLAVGTLVGAATGAVIGLGIGDDCRDPERGWFCFDRGQMAAGGAVVLGVTGALVGTIIGATTKSERWEDVPTARLGIRPSPLDGTGVAVSLSLRF